MVGVLTEVHARCFMRAGRLCRRLQWQLCESSHAAALWRLQRCTLLPTQLSTQLQTCKVRAPADNFRRTPLRPGRLGPARACQGGRQAACAARGAGRAARQRARAHLRRALPQGGGRPLPRRPAPGRARAAQVWTGPPATLLYHCAAVHSSAAACRGARCLLPPHPKSEQQKVRPHGTRGSAQSSEKVCACRCASSSV